MSSSRPEADSSPSLCVVQGGCAIRAQGWGRRCWSTHRERKLGAQGGRSHGLPCRGLSSAPPTCTARAPAPALPPWGKCVAPTEHTVKCTQEEDLRDWRHDALTASVFLEHQSRLLCLDPGTLPKSLESSRDAPSTWASATLVGDADGPLGPWC